MMEYKGFLGSVTFDDEADLFHGEVANLRDVITFQGKSVKELRKAFRDSIEDYLAFCKERGESPEKPFSGKFMIRMDPEIHRQIFLAAKFSGKSINHWAREVLSQAAQQP